MTDSSRDAQTKSPESDKKQPETVQLTAEELKAISGGAITPVGVQPKDVTTTSVGLKKV